MKLIKHLFTFRLSRKVIKDVQCVRHVYGGRRRCHGNSVFVVDVVNIVLHINDMNNNQNSSEEAVQCSALNAIAQYKVQCKNEIGTSLTGLSTKAGKVECYSMHDRIIVQNAI